MSKLIVEMEMPKKNRFCGLQCADLYCVKTSKKCNVFDTGERPDWCPIKGELPDEHGDLVDRDVSIQTFKCIEEAPYSGFDGQEAFYTPEDVVNTLLCQDVVIAAERTD